ncbi:molybdenum cofactor biosynthesis protein MoaE [Tomitella biformata]|uniref:molybdenum cofactor biosynthesis protein MoaE n=1 Tax=Tomitella biformata TaxID=630403 RepID=UPI0004ACE41B|nr:molybdenum cofactor biosynthesis protein MoaE [Tomitella biformata]
MSSDPILWRGQVTADAITLAEHEAWVSHESAGAVVGFCGVVRDHDGGRAVRRLSYSAHPSAGEVVVAIAERIATATTGVRALAVSHRVGDLEIGDEALVCAVAADHRGQAFDVCRELVEAVKLELPVWKLQVFGDGTEEWVSCA